MHSRNDVVLDDTVETMAKDDALSATQSSGTDNSVPVIQRTATAPSAILLVQPELLLGTPSQVTINSLGTGFPIGPFTARLCN